MNTENKSIIYKGRQIVFDFDHAWDKTIDTEEKASFLQKYALRAVYGLFLFFAVKKIKKLNLDKNEKKFLVYEAMNDFKKKAKKFNPYFPYFQDFSKRLDITTPTTKEIKKIIEEIE